MSKPTAPSKRVPKTYSAAMSQINWGSNNGSLSPVAGKDKYFAGTLPRTVEDISLKDIELLSEIFRGRQRLF